MTLEILRSDHLDGALHGFFTRKGGSSSGVFHGLNCGLGSSDQKNTVMVNRMRVAEALELSSSKLTGLYQVHSCDVVYAGEPFDPRPQADALVTDRPGLGLSVLTADCQPVLFSDRNAGVVGAAHAGWKGAFGGILEATIDKMIEIGAAREKIRAAIGPTISQAAYEVGAEFFQRFLDDSPENTRYFEAGKEGKYQFDLPSYSLARLKRAGVSAEWMPYCTYSDPERFFSYRRSVHHQEADFGRLISVIRL